MAKIKARKMLTPGTKPSKNKKSPGRGRPKVPGKMKGWSRVGNYRHKYTQDVLEKALKAVADKRMTLNEAAIHYGVPKTTMHDR